MQIQYSFTVTCWFILSCYDNCWSVLIQHLSSLQHLGYFDMSHHSWFMIIIIMFVFSEQPSEVFWMCAVFSVDWNCKTDLSSPALYLTYCCSSLAVFVCECVKRLFVESIAFLEDIKTVELFYLQAQLLISQVGLMRVVISHTLYHFAYLITRWCSYILTVETLYWN